MAQVGEDRTYKRGKECLLRHKIERWWKIERGREGNKDDVEELRVSQESELEQKISSERGFSSACRARSQRICQLVSGWYVENNCFGRLGKTVNRRELGLKDP